MSIFHPARLICPSCGTVAEVERTASVNADLRPDLREAMLDGTFQAHTCEKCATPLRLPPHLTYLDLGRKQFFMIEPSDMIEDWPTAETAARATFERGFGSGAPAVARRMGEGITPRLVFGWPALREKLRCHDLALDDTTLEMLKMSIMVNVDKPPIADQTELRLVGGTEEALEFEWFESASERSIVGLSVPRDIYDDVRENADAWEDVRGKFDGQMLVDLKRFVAGPG